MTTINAYQIVSESVNSGAQTLVGGVLVTGPTAALVIALRSHLKSERKTFDQLKRLNKKVSRGGYSENVKEMIRNRLRHVKRRILSSEKEFKRIRSEVIRKSQLQSKTHESNRSTNRK